MSGAHDPGLPLHNNHLGDGRGCYIDVSKNPGGVVPMNPADNGVPFTGGPGTGNAMGPLEGLIKNALQKNRSYGRFCKPSEIHEIGEDDRVQLKEPLADAVAEVVRAGVSVTIERVARADGASDAVRVQIGGSG